MKIILKHILNNIKEHKFRSILIIFSLSITITVLMLCMTMKDNIVDKYEEYLNKTTGNTDILVNTNKEILYSKITDISDKYTTVSYIGYQVDKNKFIYGINLDDILNEKLLANYQVTTLKEDEVIITQKRADKDNLKIGSKIDIDDYTLTVVDIVDSYGMFLASDNGEDDVYYLTTIKTANKIKNNQDDYINGFLVDVEDEDYNGAVDYLTNYNKDFSVSIIRQDFESSLSQIENMMILLLILVCFVSIYIISSMLKLILEERIPVIGTFRSVGASRLKMNFILFSENAVYGIISAVIGYIFGMLISYPLSSVFISTGDVKLTNRSNFEINPLYALIAVLFGILIQLIVTLLELRKTKKKSIKEIIFNTQDTKYQLSYKKVMIGLIMFIVGIILYIINKKYDFTLGILSIGLTIIGFSYLIPFILKLISNLLSKIYQKFNLNILYLASKNIYDNKIVISLTTLLTIVVSLVIMIYNISYSIKLIYADFRSYINYNVIVMDLEEDEKAYEDLFDDKFIESYSYVYFNWNNAYINGVNKNFVIFGFDKNSDFLNLQNSFEFNSDRVNNLNDNEMIIDEAYAIKNGYKIGDELEIEYDGYEKKVYTIVDYVDSSHFTASRCVGIINIDSFKKNYSDIPTQLIIKSSNQDATIKSIENKSSDINLTVQSFDDYIKSDEESTNSIMVIVYIVLGFSVGLAFIGILNNEIIAFYQRKRELAILNSTCITKRQLYRLLISEHVHSFIIACLLGLGLGAILTRIIEVSVSGIGIYMKMYFDVSGSILIIGLIFTVVISSILMPIVKLKKMKIVEEIKYE